jgi:hypothetical protein
MASLNAAAFRVSSYPLDGFFLPKPTQIVFQTTSTLEVPTSAFRNLEMNRNFLSKAPSSLVIGECAGVIFWITCELPLTPEGCSSSKVFLLCQESYSGLEGMYALVF